MEAVAHNSEFAKKVGIPQSVGKEFAAADKAKRAIGGALDVARRAKRDAGGAVSSTPWYVRHESNLMNRGPVIGNTMGRADKVNTSVPNNSFIVPSHVVSALGQGNTLAGMTQLGKMFPSGGVKSPPKPNFPKLPNPPKLGKMAKGGNSHDHVDVSLSDGEFSIGPEHVLRIGKGDYESGHRILKHFCLAITHKAIEQLKKMPHPVDSGDD
jgi:hypothetical protein